MNKKSGFVLRMVAGMYLSYLGIALFSQAMRDKPSDYMMKVVIAVIFLGVGVWYTIRNIRSLYQLTRGDSDDKKEESSDNGVKKEFAKPQHDKTKFRTAPMPVIQEEAAKSLEETNLRAADLKEETPKEETPKDADPDVIELDRIKEEETEKSEELENDYEEK